MKRYLLALLVLLVTGRVFGQQLSERATISVVTLGPSQDYVYLAFGHSAFRVNDPGNGFDYAFNYGIFDFDQPNFLLNFARGSNFYMLGVQDYPRFRAAYIEDDRYVHEQLLNLTSEQKQKVFEYLLWNAQPENRSYRYDYFYDNCATRIRDVMVKTLGSDVTFDSTYIDTDYTIRQLTDLYLGKQPWGDLGIDIGLGLPMDKKASPYEYMFLPEYIESSYNHASIKLDSVTVPIVAKSEVVFASTGTRPIRSYPHPFLVFSVLALIGIGLSVWDFKRKKLSNWFDRIVFTLSGFLGITLLLLWFATDHKAAAYNFNLLWAIPTNIIVVFFLRKDRPWLQKYFLIIAGIEAITLITWVILPQQLNTSLIPVFVVLGIRAFTQQWVRKSGVVR